MTPIKRLVVFNETFASLHKDGNICVMWHEAIRGRSATDVASAYYNVTDIRGLKYTAAGDIYYKLRLSDDWELLSQSKSKVDIITWTVLDHLYKDKIPISARKYSDLQEINCTIPADYHHFYNNL
ncbi:unnamed protein product [Acanthoscelides obtectus]|uniref:Uncharacterized protein n=1 Tax=Acanthoscelides obtectus TaxID=200917 RepID=A0A9P0PWS9_ACAOB|nr:unnamed protein product [Acanthoscelides obtectus]CAK1635798.1 hypothetical protein AOBTE_LOCUS9514 [Acanthoscelides obtectus]